MSEQYYRVRLDWPIPYFVKQAIGHASAVERILDARFYTTATDLRGVHLDIQAHLAKHYADKGLNEHDDFENFDELSNYGLEETLVRYGRSPQPEILQVEVIADPDQVELIDAALEQLALIKSLMGFTAMGYVASPNGWAVERKRLGELIEPLEHAVSRVLRASCNPDDDFTTLNIVVDQALAATRELNEFTREAIKLLNKD